MPKGEEKMTEEISKLKTICKQTIKSMIELVADLTFAYSKDPEVLFDAEQALKEIDENNDWKQLLHIQQELRLMVHLIEINYAAKNKTEQFETIHKKWKDKYLTLATTVKAIINENTP